MPLLPLQTHISKPTWLQAPTHTAGLFPARCPGVPRTLQDLDSHVLPSPTNIQTLPTSIQVPPPCKVVRGSRKRMHLCTSGMLSTLLTIKKKKKKNGSIVEALRTQGIVDGKLSNKYRGPASLSPTALSPESASGLRSVAQHHAHFAKGPFHGRKTPTPP